MHVKEQTRTCTWQHLLHVDLALLKQVSQPLLILQFSCLLKTEQEQRKVGAVLQRVGQVRNAQELSNDRTRSKLCQIRLHQWNVTFELRTLVQNI